VLPSCVVVVVAGGGHLPQELVLIGCSLPAWSWWWLAVVTCPRSWCSFGAPFLRGRGGGLVVGMQHVPTEMCRKCTRTDDLGRRA
jgi:hypothetical protein